MRNKSSLACFLITVSFALWSCSALNKQQKTVIKEFATSAKTYTDAPKELIATYSDCLFKADKLEASLKLTEDGVVSDLDRAVREELNRTSFSSNLSLTYKLLDKYFQALLNLADVDTADALKTNISTLGVNVDSLVSKTNAATGTSMPIGLGTITGGLFKYIGKKHVSQKQLKYFKEFMQKGDAIVAQTSGVLDRLINSLINGDLRNGNDQLKQVFLRYLKELDSSNKKPSDYLKELNPVYLDIKTCYQKAILLMMQLAVVNRNLAAAHHEALRILYKKEKKISTPKLAEFMESVEQLNDMIKQFKGSDK